MNASGGRFVAWCGFWFGSLMSIAGNYLHAWLGAVPPTVPAQLGAAVWPIALLISVEVLSRVQWPATWSWNLARYGGAGTVALGSAVISYGHLHEVLVSWNYGPLGAGVGPIVLDGLMVVSGFALLLHAPVAPAGEPDLPSVAEFEKLLTQSSHGAAARANEMAPTGRFQVAEVPLTQARRVPVSEERLAEHAPNLTRVSLLRERPTTLHAVPTSETDEAAALGVTLDPPVEGETDDDRRRREERNRKRLARARK